MKEIFIVTYGYDVILNLRSLVKLIPDPKHDNTDAISRCFNPQYCSCDMEILKKGLHELHCPLKVNKTIPFQHLQTLQKEKSLGKSKRNLLSQIALWRSQYSSTLHRLQIEDPDINPVLQQNLKNEWPSRNEQNTYSVATRHYLACGTNSISKIYSCIILAQQH